MSNTMSNSIIKVIRLSEALSEPADAWGDDPVTDASSEPENAADANVAPTGTALEANAAALDADAARWPRTRLAYCCHVCWQDESICTCYITAKHWGLE